MGPPHSELHYPPTHVGPQHCEKCDAFTVFLSGGSTTLLPLKPWLSGLLKFCKQLDLSFLTTVAYRGTKITTTLRVHIPVAITATKNLEDTMLPVNYRSWQCSFSELPKSCWKWELTFLSTITFGATKFFSAVGGDIPVDRSFQSYHNFDNFKNWCSCSYQSYQKLRRHYASRQLSELTT